MFGNGLAEGGSRKQAPGHHVQRLFRRADRAHAMMDASRPQPALRDFETASLAQKQIAGRHADIVQQDFRMPRSEEHTSELQSLMRISYAVFCLKKKKT